MTNDDHWHDDEPLDPVRVVLGIVAITVLGVGIAVAWGLVVLW